MLGVRWFACPTCETVYASPDEPPGCDACGGRNLRELRLDHGGASYFTPPRDTE